jgi:hypothetical protein
VETRRLEWAGHVAGLGMQENLKEATCKEKRMRRLQDHGSWEIYCEGDWPMEMTQDRVQWQALVLAVLNLRVQLPQI